MLVFSFSKGTTSYESYEPYGSAVYEVHTVCVLQAENGLSQQEINLLVRETNAFSNELSSDGEDTNAELE